MNRYVTIVALILFAPSIANAAERTRLTIQPDQIVSPLQRVNIYVRDLDKSLRLYRDILGLKVTADLTWRTPTGGAKAAAPNLEFRTVVLSADDGATGKIGLNQIAPARKSVSPSKATRMEAGNVGVVLGTSDIRGIYQKISDAGLIVISPPLTVEVSGKPGGTEMSFRDPDGTIITLVQLGGAAK